MINTLDVINGFEPSCKENIVIIGQPRSGKTRMLQIVLNDVIKSGKLSKLVIFDTKYQEYSHLFSHEQKIHVFGMPPEYSSEARGEWIVNLFNQHSDKFLTISPLEQENTSCLFVVDDYVDDYENPKHGDAFYDKLLASHTTNASVVLSAQFPHKINKRIFSNTREFLIGKLNGKSKDFTILKNLYEDYSGVGNDGFDQFISTLSQLDTGYFFHFYSNAKNEKKIELVNTL